MRTSKRTLAVVGACALFVVTSATRVATQEVYDILQFDGFTEGPWSDVDETTLEVPRVPDESVALDGSVSSEEYGDFEGVTVTPGENAYLLNWPGDRSWDGPEDSSFTFYLAQDADYLYVGVVVLDDVVNSDNIPREYWKDDSIEIVVDAFNDRYDVNTDQRTNPYGGHGYFNFEGKFSEWDDVAGQDPRGHWCAAVPWTYGPDAEIFGFGMNIDDGWSTEIRLSKSLFQDPAVGNLLEQGYLMGFNIGLDDDDGRGPEGTNGTAERSKDLELQYWWANRLRPAGWNAQAAAAYTPEEIEARDYMDDFALVIDQNGRLTLGGTGEISFPGGGSTEVEFRRGDSNVDGNRDLSDAVFLLNHLFLGGAAPSCQKSADSNDSGVLDLSDAIYLLNFLFLGGQAIPDPADLCGGDPTPDELTCEDYAASCD